MKILLIGINYKPELTGIGKYSGEMCEWLVENGHSVRVITAPPYYPEWEIQENYSGWLYSYEEIRGVKIWRCPLWVPSCPTGLKRIIHLATFALSSFPKIMAQVFWRPDVVITIEPPFFCTPSALICSKLSGAKSWLHIQDFEIDAAFELGLLKAKWLRGLINGIESWMMRRFDMVSTISTKMVERLKIEKRISTAKTSLFQNWVDTESIFPLDEPDAMREELGIAQSEIVALYSGNMGEKQGLEVVLETAVLLSSEQDIVFVLCGDGAARVRLQKQYENLRNVIWIPLQPLDRLNDLLNMADIHILPQRAGAADLLMPSKLTGMLSSGRPVIATAAKNTQIAEVIVDCGIVVEPENALLLSDAILSLSRDEHGREKLGARARDFAIKNWSKDGILNRFDRQLKEL